MKNHVNFAVGSDKNSTKNTRANVEGGIIKQKHLYLILVSAIASAHHSWA
jgi:hypothetical protein